MSDTEPNWSDYAWRAGMVASRSDSRDYAEEEFNRRYCDFCDSSPCTSPDNHRREIEMEEISRSLDPNPWNV